MRGFICAILYLLLFGHTGHTQSYGLQFSSHEAVQEKRTALSIGAMAPLTFDEETDISFDLLFAPHMEIYFGYIFRLITTEKQHIDLLYNQQQRIFTMIIGDRPAASFTIDSLQLYNHWTHLDIRINTRQQQVALYVNNKYQGRSKLTWQQPQPLHFSMYFGANEVEGFQTADIPPMSLKDLKITEKGKEGYYWPLEENAGTQSKDRVQGSLAQISNANWIKPRHQHWQPISTFTAAGNVSTAFDTKAEVLYIIAEDSLYALSLGNGQLQSTPLAHSHAPLLPGNQSIVHPLDSRLYNFYIDEQALSNYNAATRRWDTDFTPAELTQYWHANKFIATVDSSLYVLGGYGQLQYKNQVLRCHLPDRKWETVTTKGDFFMPRYLAALGSTPSGDTAYLLGGYGSPTGQQVLNPRYNYDLLAYSVKDRAFHKIYQLPEQEKPFCFANSLVVHSGSQEFYGLIYPKDKFNSGLQLIQGSLQKPDLRLLGDTIPYSFHDIQSFADLYECPVSKKLVAVTLYTAKESNTTSIKIYTIAAPPNQREAAMPLAASHSFPWYIVLLLLTGGVLVIVWLLLKKRRTPIPVKAMDQVQPAIPVAPPVSIPPIASVQEIPVLPPVKAGKRAKIFLFGAFEVYDKEGEDLTRLFTPLLKELFLLIVISTLRSGKGVSSEKLYSTLWRDKSNKDAQNNRSVNLVKLKGILSRLGASSIVNEANRWSFQYQEEEIEIDLAAFLQLLQSPGPQSKQEISQLLSIIERGSFLAGMDYAWLEDIQSDVANKVLDALSAAIGPYASDADLLPEIANGIFLFDPVNEEALRIKCKNLSDSGRHSVAKATFEKFAREYQQMYGEEFGKSFQEVIG